jgi:hypothetical protein
MENPVLVVCGASRRDLLVAVRTAACRVDRLEQEVQPVREHGERTLRDGHRTAPPMRPVHGLQTTEPELYDPEPHVSRMVVKDV